jgi:hypothetical protein
MDNKTYRIKLTDPQAQRVWDLIGTGLGLGEFTIYLDVITGTKSSLLGLSEVLERGDKISKQTAAKIRKEIEGRTP